MTVRLVVAVTDRDWFDYLRAKPSISEVNFWAPGAAPFRALQAGELFLFKLHAPTNFIVGAGSSRMQAPSHAPLLGKPFKMGMGPRRSRKCEDG
jgi:putative restriction endonuclease